LNLARLDAIAASSASKPLFRSETNRKEAAYIWPLTRT
jgi:hypothetical protein